MPTIASVKEQLQFISEGGSVSRFHTRQTIKDDTDAAHQWGVVMMTLMICNGRHIAPRPQLLLAAATHDLGEQVASDVNAPTKWYIPGLAEQLEKLEMNVRSFFGFDFSKELTEEEARILKLADTFDGLLLCCREAALGNRNTILMWNRWVGKLSGGHIPSSEVEIFNAIVEIWEESNGVTGHEATRQYGERYEPTGPAFEVFGYNYARTDRGKPLSGTEDTALGLRSATSVSGRPDK